MDMFPRGVRFEPTDVEMINYFLRRLVEGKIIRPGLIHEFDIYQRPPWELPMEYQHGKEVATMYYFTPRHCLTDSGSRVKRTVGDHGHWDGKSREIVIKIGSKVVGYKTQLVYKIGKGKEMKTTPWIMHEFILHSSEGKFEDKALCRIYNKKNRRGGEPEEQPPPQRRRMVEQATSLINPNHQWVDEEAMISALQLQSMPLTSSTAEHPATSVQHCNNVGVEDNGGSMASLVLDYEPVFSFEDLVNIEEWMGREAPEGQATMERERVDAPSLSDPSYMEAQAHSSLPALTSEAKLHPLSTSISPTYAPICNMMLPTHKHSDDLAADTMVIERATNTEEVGTTPINSNEDVAVTAVDDWDVELLLSDPEFDRSMNRMNVLLSEIQDLYGASYY